MAREKPQAKTRYDFVTHRFMGKRFADNTLDVDVLQEIIAYKQLVLAVARHLSRGDPGRTRAQRGLEKGLELALSVTHEGSFEVTLVQSAPNTWPLFGGVPPGYQDIYTRARDFVADTIQRANNGIGVLPDEVVQCFDRFGKHLAPDESISISAPDKSGVASYSTQVRTAILRAQNSDYEDIAQVEGELRTVSLDARKFEIKLDDGVKLAGSFSPDDEAKITKALRVHKIAHVRISGRGQYAPGGVLKQITSADNIVLTVVMAGADPKEMAIDRQIAGLSTPQDLGEDGIVTLDDAYLAAVCDVLHELTDDARLPLPYLYATPNRTVQAEWPVPPFEIMCEILREPWLSVDAMVVNVDSGSDYHNIFESIEQPQAAEELVRWLRPFMLREVSSDE